MAFIACRKEENTLNKDTSKSEEALYYSSYLDSINKSILESAKIEQKIDLRGLSPEAKKRIAADLIGCIEGGILAFKGSGGNPWATSFGVFLGGALFSYAARIVNPNNTAVFYPSITTFATNDLDSIGKQHNQFLSYSLNNLTSNSATLAYIRSVYPNGNTLPILDSLLLNSINGLIIKLNDSNLNNIISMVSFPILDYSTSSNTILYNFCLGLNGVNNLNQLTQLNDSYINYINANNSLSTAEKQLLKLNVSVGLHSTYFNLNNYN